MARLYADEDFDYRVVVELRALGHDILTVQEAGRGGVGRGDPLVFADAIAIGRSVLTFNRRHYFRLARSAPSHFGVVAPTRDDDYVALARRIHDAICHLPSLDNQVIRVYRPSTP